METHQAYTTSEERGAQCTSCDDWVPPGEDCVLLQPATVNKKGSARPNATAFHGVLCMGCFEAK